MKRWFFKRWTWAGVLGLTAAVGLALGAGKDAPPGPSAPPKVGNVITLKFQKGAEKQVKILKAEKHADGSYQCEVKDMKTGEVFTLIDKSHMPPAGKSSPQASKSSSPASQAATPKAIGSKSAAPAAKVPDTKIATAPPQFAPPLAPPKAPVADFSPAAKQTFGDPLMSESGGTVPASARERKLLAPSKPNTVAAPAPMPETTAEPQKKHGFLRRLFSKDKEPTPPLPPTSMPTKSVKTSQSLVPNQSVKPAPAFNPSTSVFESGPAARPSSKPNTTFAPSIPAFEPGAAATQPAPRLGSSSTPSSAPKLFPTPTPGTSEPPRSSRPNLGSALLPNPGGVALQPVKPPTPVVPVPVTPPTAPPTAAPLPLPIPTAPAVIPAPASRVPSTPAIPVIPSTPGVVPAVPGPSGLPSIPALPGGMSHRGSPVMQAGLTTHTTTVAMALAHDIQPFVTTLRTAAAPSVRAMAAKGLAGGRHASTDAVKSILFIACTTDPSPFVRACCIDELCKLGYFEPNFMAHLHKSCADPSEEVRASAKEALKKMMPQK